MGLLDQAKDALGGQMGDALGGMAGGNAGSMGAVLELLQNPQLGGLSGLIGAFQSNGLGDIVNSWIGQGDNLPISPDQIQNALGSDRLQGLASQLNTSPQEASGTLANLLPQLVNNLTPDGNVPDNDAIAKGIEMLSGKIPGLG